MNAFKQAFFTLAFGILVVLAAPAQSASESDGERFLLSATTPEAFEQALERSQAVLKAHGFAVAHVQLCDGGLQVRGYETEGYKVIFFGRIDEVRALSKTYPQLIPLLPFKMAVQAEQGSTVVSLVNPAEMRDLLQADEILAAQLSQWEQEFRAVLADVAKPSAKPSVNQLAQTDVD